MPPRCTAKATAAGRAAASATSAPSASTRTSTSRQGRGVCSFATTRSWPSAAAVCATSASRQASVSSTRNSVGTTACQICRPRWGWPNWSAWTLLSSARGTWGSATANCCPRSPVSSCLSRGATTQRASTGFTALCSRMTFPLTRPRRCDAWARSGSVPAPFSGPCTSSRYFAKWGCSPTNITLLRSGSRAADFICRAASV